MNRLVRTMTAAALAASMSAVLLAQAPALDIRMGYWEITSNMTMAGDMPGMDMSKMSAQQQAQMAAAMKAMMAPHTTVTKDCVTREEFDKNGLMFGQNDSNDCKQVLTMNTKTALEGTVSCTGTHQMSGHMRIDATSPTSVKAAMQGSNSEGGKTMTVNITLDGKFLSATCPKE